MSYTLAIVGRPNVGKSTLFNRFIGRPHAIVDNEAGVTRDRQYGMCEWGGRVMHVVDTGGFVAQGQAIFEREIARQVHIAIEEADAIIFMVDAKDGVTVLDEEVARLLYAVKKKVYLAVNKVDNYNRVLESAEFYALGFEHLFLVAANSGSGTGDLLDKVVSDMPKECAAEALAEDLPRIAIIGQPNVGKSTLLNALLGEERSIVSPVAHTTRDSISTPYHLYGHHCILTDTAGIRKKNKEKDNLEFYSIIRAVKQIDRSEVILLLIDAQEGIRHQDLYLFELAARKGKGVVVLVNKWDVVAKDTGTAKEWETLLRQKLAPFSDVPLLFISATEKQRIFKAMELAMAVAARRGQRIPTSRLNTFLTQATARQAAPVYRGHSIKIKYGTQLDKTIMPSFVFFCNFPQGIKEPYRNYLENQFRKTFDFTGVPVRFFFRKDGDRRF